jgi:hypothetical protein
MISTISEYHALRPARFRFLQSLDLRRSFSDECASSYELTVVLAEAAQANAPRLSLSFTGVVNLKIGDLNGLIGHLIEIRSIADRGLDGLGFCVVEEENGGFSFECKSFSGEVL